MLLHSVLSVLFFVFLSVQGAALPAVKRDPNDDRSSFAGSAAVQWLDSGSLVHIREFWMTFNGRLMMSSYDEDGEGDGWKSVATDYVVNSDSGGDSIAAVSVRPNTPTHAIHVYFTQGSEKYMKSAVYQVPQNNWLGDTGFNNLNIKGLSPAAAVGWMEPNAQYAQIRVYFTEMTGTSGAVVTYNWKLFEARFDNGWAKRQIHTFQQSRGTPSNAVAAITWSGNTGRQIKVYFYGPDYLGELSWSEQNLSWSETKQFAEEWNEQRNRYPLAAVEYTGNNGHQIRLYRNTPRASSPNAVHEWSYDGSQQKWTEKDLPSNMVTNTQGSALPAAVAWTTGAGASQVHIRLYQVRQTSDYLKVTESTFDTGIGWQPNTHKL